MKMMKKEVDVHVIARIDYQLIHKSSTADSGNRVLQPAAASDGEKKKDEGINGRKIKSISKMKDQLIRWAAAARYQKGPAAGNYFGRKVLQFRKNTELRSVSDYDDELSIDSPKISFRWDVESFMSSSAISMDSSSSSNSLGAHHDLFLSAILHPSNPTLFHGSDYDHTKGNWITTDSEFVVLEL